VAISARRNDRLLWPTLCKAQHQRHFEIPEGLPELGKRAATGTRIVPISIYHKWPLLMDFDFIGPTGDPTSLYLRTTNQKLDLGLLLGMTDLALALGASSGAPLSGADLRVAAQRQARKGDALVPALRRELAKVIESREPSQHEVARAVNQLRDDLVKMLADALERERRLDRNHIAEQIAATVDLAARLAGSSILWVAVQGEPGTDRIAKFSYCDAYRASVPDVPDSAPRRKATDIQRPRVRDAWWKRAMIACSWRHRNLFISLPHAGRYVRFHLDIRAPHGSIELVEVDAMALPPATADHDLRDAEVSSVEKLARKYPEVNLPDEWVGPDSSRFYLDYGEPIVLASASTRRGRSPGKASGSDHEATVEIIDGRAHAYLGARGAPSHRVFLQLKLAAPRNGFIGNCMLAALLVAAMMGAVCADLQSAAHNLEPTVVLLSVVPVVLGYVLVRPGEQALERYHISGVRSMALLSGATPILGALALVLAHISAKGEPDLSNVRKVWFALVFISVATAAGLAVSFFRAAPPRDAS
jgi:hypothetical protein